MWRDIDSLRKQNESTKKEIESMRSKSKQTEIETEQLRSETEILKRQNKALELIESNDLNTLLRDSTITGKNDSDHSEDQLDLDLLAEKFVALGCDVDDVPFLFDVLELCPVLIDPMQSDLAEAAVQGQGDELVQTLDLDDQTYRVVPAMLIPDLWQESPHNLLRQHEEHGRDAFDELIDYILANLGEPLPLTNLENHSHYSRRTLLYVFRDRFGCTPSQWIRKQRLEMAHHRLQNPQPRDSVSEIAFACGYRSMTLFSYHFQQHYQLKPSEVLRQGRNQNRSTADALDPALVPVRRTLDGSGET